MKTVKTKSRAPMMLAVAAALALPVVLTAGIGIYRAEREPVKRSVAERAAPVPPADAAEADRADGEP